MLSWTRYSRSLYASSSDPWAIAAKARSAPSMSCRRVASRRASAPGPPPDDGGRRRPGGASRERSRPSAGCGSCCGRAPSGRAAPLRLGQLLRHLVGGGQGHQGVVAVVVLAAEGAGVGQGARPRRARGGRSPPLSRSTTIGRSRSAGVSCIRSTSGSSDPNVRWPSAPSGQGGRRQAQVLGERRADAGDQHAPAHVREELTTMIAIHGLSPWAVCPLERSGRFASTLRH